MSLSATECLLQMSDELHALEDYQSGVPRWCTGCGDNAILAAVQSNVLVLRRQHTPHRYQILMLTEV